MSIVTIIEMTSKPDSVQELRAFLSPAETRAFEGNEGIEVTVDAENPNRIVVLTHWATQDAMQAYLAARAEAGEGLFELLEGGRDGLSVRTFEVVEKPRAKRSKTR